MRRTSVTSVVLLVALLLSMGGVARAQQMAVLTSGGSSTKPASIADMRQGIRSLESAARNSSSPIKGPLLDSLQKQRVQLHDLLQRRVASLRAYEPTISSPAEKAVVEGEINKHTVELRALEGQIRRYAAEAAPAVSPLSPATLRAPMAAPLPRRQDTLQSQFEAKVDDVVASVGAETSALRKAARADFLSQASEALAFALVSRVANKPIVAAIEENRVDKQVGGTEAGAGSTSLVSKGAAPAILGFAVEHGALTRDISGTTVTYRGNLVGTIEALRKQGFVTSYRDDEPGARFLRRLSYSFSFDTSRGDTAGMLLADRQQLSAYSVRYEIINRRDSRSPRYEEKWRELATADFQGVVNEVNNIIGTVFRTDRDFIAWNDEAKAAIARQTTPEGVRAEVIRQLNRMPDADEMSPDLKERIEAFGKNMTNFLRRRDQLFEFIENGPLVTVEYIADRRVDAVDLSTLKFIAEGDFMSFFGFADGKTDLTYNGSMTFYNSKPGPGVRRLRDFDHSVQLDVPFTAGELGSIILSFAGKYKRIMDDETMSDPTSMLSGPTMARKGDIAVGQLKLSFPVRGLRFPVSVTFANRTELIKEKEVRANFGFTFDLDPLFARFKP